MLNKDLNKKLLFNKYRIKRIIYKSSNCVIYEGINIKNNESVAMKCEKRTAMINLVESEAYFLVYLKGFGIPKIISYGISGLYNILIEELLGLSISSFWKLKKNKNKSKSELLKDICMIALQGIDRLEYIHSKNVIHRDIKPHNFLIGKKDPKIIYLIDFGFSRKYRSSRTGKHIKFQTLKYTCGTLRFLSMNGNRGYELSRRDDLESLGYMLIYLAKNNLPWLKLELEDKEEKIIIREIFKLKNTITPEKLCMGLNEEFVEYMKYVRNLEFEGKPDYNYLKGLFISILSRNELKNDLLFSWIINKRIIKKDESENYIRYSYKKKGSAQKRLYNQIKNKLDSNSKSKSKEINNNISIKKEINNNKKTYNFDNDQSYEDNELIKHNYINIFTQDNNKNLISKTPIQYYKTDLDINDNNINKNTNNLSPIKKDFLYNIFLKFNVPKTSNILKNKILIPNNNNKSRNNTKTTIPKNTSYKTLYEREKTKINKKKLNINNNNTVLHFQNIISKDNKNISNYFNYNSINNSFLKINQNNNNISKYSNYNSINNSYLVMNKNKKTIYLNDKIKENKQNNNYNKIINISNNNNIKLRNKNSNNNTIINNSFKNNTYNNLRNNNYTIRKLIINNFNQI